METPRAAKFMSGEDTLVKREVGDSREESRGVKPNSQGCGEE